MISRVEKKPLSARKIALQRGLEQAATALATMVKDPVSIKLGSGRPPLVGVSIWLTLQGALPGAICLCLPETLALELAKRLTQTRDLSLFDEMARSALMECGNLLASAFVAYFDESCGLRTLPSPPRLSLVPWQLPPFTEAFAAEFAVDFCQIQGQIFIGLDTAALQALAAEGAEG